MAEPGVVRRFNVRISLRDGITLSADLALPESLPAPAVVLRTPYGKTGERQSNRGAVFAKAGYALVLADVRGRGDSDGVFQPYRNDGRDGAEVIAWVAEQEWCTGDVATYGASYSGRIQWLTALERPPALRAMMCLVTPSDPFVEIPTGLPTPMHINWHRFVDGRMPHRLRVEIASSAFPKYDVNLGAGGDMITETKGVPARNRLWHTPSHPSRLILD
ncbi:MAG TPA: CocE/NonD family hydrolase [Streptosporangiaceae bacterium]|nr:CocE/NonD family hydrolase [Streptosporangiaceae bacterium]